MTPPSSISDLRATSLGPRGKANLGFLSRARRDFLRRRRPPPGDDEQDEHGSLSTRRSERFNRWLEEQLHPESAAREEEAKEGRRPEAPSAGAGAALAATDGSASAGAGAGAVEAGEDVQMADEQ